MERRPPEPRQGPAALLDLFSPEHLRPTVIVIGIVVALIVFVMTRGDSSSERTGSDPDEPDRVSTDIRGEFVRWEPVDDARGYAYFTITNHGDAAATAECSVRVSNDFGNFGFDSLVGERIAAGDTFTGRMAISVSEGSFLINEGEVTDC